METRKGLKGISSLKSKFGDKKGRKLRLPSTIKDVDEDKQQSFTRPKSRRSSSINYSKEISVEKGFKQRKSNQRVRTDDPYYRARPMSQFLADAEKEYKEVTKKNALPEERALENYRRLAQACQYAEKDHAGRPLTYHPSCKPGSAFLQYLVPFSEEAKGHMRHVRKLEVWFPDTVVCADGMLQWFYSNSQGQLDVTTHFPEKSVVEKLGDFRFEQDLTAILKQSKMRNLPGKGTVQQARGNTAMLCTTGDLRSIVKEMFNAATGYEKSVQKYIKSKGPFAFLYRAVVELRQPPFAWMITNKAMYQDATQEGVDISSCTIVQPAKDHSTTITKLACNACTDTTEMTKKLWGHIESMLQRRLELLVADYTRDEGGRWWFLQVKAFRFKGIEPHRPIKIPLVFRRAIHGLPPPDSEEEEDDKSDGDIEKEKEDAYRKRKKGAYQLKPSVPPTCTRRLIQCKSCQGWHTNEELPFKMTAKMIKTTILHLRRRLPPDKCPTAFQGSLENLISLSRVEKRLPGQGGIKYHHFRVCQLCFDLYQDEAKVIELEKRITQLYCSKNNLNKEDEQKKAKNASEEDHAVNALTKLDQVHKWGYELPKWLHCTPVVERKQVPIHLTLCRMMIAVHQLIDLPRKVLPPFVNEGSAIPLRIVYTLMGTTHIANLKAHFECKTPQNSQQATGFSEELPSPLILRNPDAEELISIPIHFLRMHYFLSPKTPLEDPLPHDSGLGEFIASQSEVDIGLLVESTWKDMNKITPMGSGLAGFSQHSGASYFTGKRSYIAKMNSSRSLGAVFDTNSKSNKKPIVRKHSDTEFLEFLEERERGWLGNVRLPLAQFRNSYVKRLDLMMPLSVDVEAEDGRAALCTVQATLGLERTRSSLDQMTIPFPLMKHRGVYLATSNSEYPMSDPLPEEWKNLIPQTPDTAASDSTPFGASSNSFNILSRLGSLMNKSPTEENSAELPDAVWCITVSLLEGHHLPLQGSSKHDWICCYKFFNDSGGKVDEFWGESKDPEEVSNLMNESDSPRQNTIFFKCQHRHLFKGRLADLTKYLKEKVKILHVELGPAARKLYVNVDDPFQSEEDSWTAFEQKESKLFDLSPKPSMSKRKSYGLTSCLKTQIDISDLGNLRNIEGIYTLKRDDPLEIKLEPHQFPAYLSAHVYLYQIGPPEDEAEKMRGNGAWMPPRAVVKSEVFPGVKALTQET